MAGLLDRARLLLRRLVASRAQAPAEDARSWLRAGDLAAERGDDQEADRCYGHVDVLCDGRPEQLALRATAREGRWNLAGALADLEASDTVAERPLRTARLLRQLGQWDEAQAVLVAVVDRSGVAPARAALWQLLRLRGASQASGLLADVGAAPGGQLLRAVDAALEDDLARAREALAAAEASPELRRTAREWGLALGLRPAGESPAISDDWLGLLETRLQGRIDDEHLEARARAAKGRRTSARRLHDAHALMALLARGRSDQAAERRHLQAAAARGDFGELQDVWVHVRARRLGLSLAHRPPTVEPLVGASDPAQFAASSST